MGNPSVSLPDWMLEEIHERRTKASNRSEYIRQAVQARFDAEDGGEWVNPDDDTDSEQEIPAD